MLAITWGLSSDTPGLGAPAVINLTAKEWRYEPGEVSSSAGEITFEVNNGGLIEHNFVVVDAARQKRAEIPYIEPGETLRATANLQPGVYTIYCGLPGHRDAGMVATLRVR
ncbi:MAG TPA: cupredoxin domain-containing protein [bacterium]|nr:cupredoxin domain-containing protein [bacterium]